jgi:hypothetical protein
VNSARERGGKLLLRMKKQRSNSSAVPLRPRASLPARM